MKKSEKRLFSLSLAAAMLFALPTSANAMHIMEGYLPMGHAVVWGVLCLPFLVAGFLSIKKTITQNRKVLLVLAMVIFACGVIASYMLTNYTNLHMRKLAIWVDAAGLGLTALLPDWFSPIAGVYPIFFCSAFQWGVYSGADGFNSATVFITNNFKQSVLGWTQYALTKDKEFKRKAVLYSNTVLMFFLGALLGVTGVAAFGNALGACVGFIPLAVARIFISIGELPVEDETPEETEEEAEEMLEEAKILEKEEKKKI